MRDKPTHPELDQAVQNRLARLSASTVDTTRLQRRMQSLIAESVTPDAGQRRMWIAWRPALALAASILVVVALGVTLATLGNSPAMAAPSHLAQLHAQANHADSSATAVSSVEEANQVLSGQWGDLPSIPIVDTATLHACCIHDFMDDRVVCLVLRDGEETLTLVVGHARSFRPTKGREVHIGGRKFYVHRVDGLLMAMTQQDNRFVCLMGEVTEERLLRIAGELRF